MNKNLLTKAGIGAALSTILVGLMATVAAAQTTTTEYTPAQAKTAAEGFLGTLVSAVAPIMLAVAGGVIGLLVLGWAIRLVFSKVRSFAHF